MNPLKLVKTFSSETKPIINTQKITSAILSSKESGANLNANRASETLSSRELENFLNGVNNPIETQSDDDDEFLKLFK